MNRYPKPTLFEPKNKQKYIGDVTKIVCRSSWERSFSRFLDVNSNVRYWNSEEVVIPYISPVDNAEHRYFIDYYVEFTNGKRVLIEIKPEIQSVTPIEPKRKTAKAINRYNESLKTHAVNQTKWEYAREFAKRNNMIFLVMTERELTELGMIFI